jgi:hypothetical protein
MEKPWLTHIATLINHIVKLALRGSKERGLTFFAVVLFGSNISTYPWLSRIIVASYPCSLSLFLPCMSYVQLVCPSWGRGGP